MYIDVIFGMMLAFIMVAFCYWIVAPLCKLRGKEELMKLFMHIEIVGMYLAAIILFIYYMVRWFFW